MTSKSSTDTFGHNIGDRMLRDVANLIQSQLREYDFLARYAGDEFVALLPDLTAAQVQELCERLEELFRPFRLLCVRTPCAGGHQHRRVSLRDGWRDTRSAPHFRGSGNVSRQSAHK